MTGYIVPRAADAGEAPQAILDYLTTCRGPAAVLAALVFLRHMERISPEWVRQSREALDADDEKVRQTT